MATYLIINKYNTIQYIMMRSHYTNGHFDDEFGYDMIRP